MDKYLKKSKKDSSPVADIVSDIEEEEEEVIFKAAENKSVKRCKKTSAVWRYFKKSNDKKIAKCLQCGNVYKTSRNTSNLREHLQRMHPQIKSSECSSRSSQSSLNSFFAKTIRYEENSNRKKAIDVALSEFVAEYYQPYNIVNNNSFERLVSVLEPWYNLPSKNTLKTC